VERESQLLALRVFEINVICLKIHCYLLASLKKANGKTVTGLKQDKSCTYDLRSETNEPHCKKVE